MECADQSIQTVRTHDHCDRRHTRRITGVCTYTGEPRGYWDGDTLVVETTNFNGRTGAHFGGNEVPTSEHLRLIEHFTRVSDTSIEYQVTVEDLDTWMRPWTAAFPLTRDDAYEWSEYACHEGNYALRNILSAARTLERQRR